MKNFISFLLISLFTLQTGIVAFAQTSNCPAPYEEKNGVVVIETENLSLPSGWQKRTTAGGYTGSGYIEWVNAENFSKTGVGLIETTVRINKTGKYIFQWRNRVGKGSSLTEHNDTWLRFPNASDFYGEKGTRKVYPYGTGKTPNPNGAGSDGWFKVYFNAGIWDWAWTSWVSDRDPMQVVVEFDTPGVYKLQISARSAAHLLDRMVLYHSSVNPATAQASAETKCTTGSTNQPPVTANPIPDRTGTVGERFSYSFPTNTFSDPNGDALSYSANLSSGASLPSWLTFSASTRTFSGVPTGTATLTVRVTANDGKGGQTTDDFIIRINAAPTDPVTVYRINAGGSSYTAPDGKVFSADSYASGGSIYSRSGDITNTTQDALYQTERYGAFSYNVPVSNGSYTVILHFAEIYADGTNQRKFHVDIEGQRKLSEYDIFAKAGGAWKAVQESFAVDVTDGTLTIGFLKGSINNAKVSAIEIIKGGAAVVTTPFRINAGGSSYTGSDGKVFNADSYVSGGTIYSRSGDITNTTQDALYQTERYGAFSYNIPVSNGNYTVILHFAEIYADGTNQRKFHVDIEGQRKLSEYDIFAKAGGAWKAVQESFAVDVTDGTLTIGFLKGSINNAKVSAIEIIKGGATARLGTEPFMDSAEGSPVIRTYPNPTGGTVTIEGVNTTCSDFRVSLINGLRESSPRQVITSANQVQVMLGDLPTGLYLLRISQCGTSHTEKVIVRH